MENNSILILHSLFEVIGGGEYVALKLYDEFRKKGYRVSIVSVTDVPIEEIRSRFNIDVSPEDLHVFKDLYPEFMGVMKGRLVRLKRIVTYHRLFNDKRVRELMESYDIVIDTQSNIPTPVDVSYIHCPAIFDYFRLGSGRLYDRLIRFLYKRWFGKSMSGMVVANSTFTARIVWDYYKVYPQIVYPPVNVEFFMDGNIKDREDIIITVSRLSIEKNLWVVPRIASLLPHYKFIIAGGYEEDSKIVLEQINNEIERLGVENIEIIFNVPHRELKKLLSRAKFYLHPLFAEHFGISVVEAMAAGVVPIVYCRSGSYTDIVSLVDKRLCYWDENNVKRIINWLSRNDDFRVYLAMKSEMVARNFSIEKFVSRMENIFKFILRIKKWGG